MNSSSSRSAALADDYLATSDRDQWSRKTIPSDLGYDYRGVVAIATRLASVGTQRDAAPDGRCPFV